VSSRFHFCIRCY